ncbi:coiled-coil domain-containing protein 122-like isoform X1 [Centruroides vittatus]|uniref:coiled-coil domain-containing protein 122-like isoform X1 n=1 Tax=Centruroides vittatus TaxID=120091 RepID=UPI00350FCAD7
MDSRFLSAAQLSAYSSFSSTAGIQDRTDQWISKRIIKKKENISFLELENRIFVMFFNQLVNSFDICTVDDSGLQILFESEKNQNLTFSMLSKEYVCIKRLSRFNLSDTEKLTNQQKYTIARKVLDNVEIHRRMNMKNRSKILFELKTEIEELDMKITDLNKQQAEFDQLIKNKITQEKIQQYFEKQYKNQVELNQNLQIRIAVYQLKQRKILKEIKTIEDIGDIKKITFEQMEFFITKDLGKIKIFQKELLHKFELIQQVKQRCNKYIDQLKTIERKQKIIQQKTEQNYSRSEKLHSEIERIQKELRSNEKEYAEFLNKLHNCEPISVNDFLMQKDSVKQAKILQNRWKRKFHLQKVNKFY